MSFASKELELNSEINKIDLEMLSLIQKKLALMLQINKPIVSNKKNKKDRKDKNLVTEDNKYQLELIHIGRKLGVRRTLIRKIFRSLEQEDAYFQKKKLKNTLSSN